MSADSQATKKIITPGKEEVYPMPGDTVHIHYVGTLVDGTKFDSSRDRGRPFSTIIGHNRVIKAWDELVPTMKLGEVANFKCPSHTAYGERGFPGLIPPHSCLLFEVELLKICKPDEPKEPNVETKVEPKVEPKMEPKVEEVSK